MAIPYAIDFQTQRVYATIHNDLQMLLQKPFFYQAQYEDALQVASMPLMSLPDSSINIPMLFIHSIGRCGSTLMSKIMSALGILCFSEPDVFSQLSYAKQKGQLHRAELISLSTRLFRLFPIADCPGAVAFKFRSFCSNIAVELHKAWGDSRSMFMIRNRHEWAYSMYRALNRSPEFCAYKLRSALIELAELNAVTRGLIIMNYDSLVTNRSECVGQICELIGRPLNGMEQAIDSAFQEDSQAGTRLSRRSKGASDLDLAEIASDFDQHWACVRPSAVIEELNLEDVY
jgi:hypothetical protein